jgi:hypothetical protein
VAVAITHGDFDISSSMKPGMPGMLHEQGELPGEKMSAGSQEYRVIHKFMKHSFTSSLLRTLL